MRYFLLLSLLFTVALSVHYQEGAKLEISVGSIYPLKASVQQYPYATVPLPRPQGTHVHVERGISERIKVLDMRTVYRLHFNISSERTLSSTEDERVMDDNYIYFNQSDVRTFIRGIDKNLVYDLDVDGIKVSVPLGYRTRDLEKLGGRVHTLASHLIFNIYVNGDRVVLVGVSAPRELGTVLESIRPDESLPVRFSYEVNFIPSTIPPENRGPLQVAVPRSSVRWIALLLALGGALASTLILRATLKNQVRSKLAALERADLGSGGFHSIRFDVWRAPRRPEAFAGLVGGAVHLVFSVGVTVLVDALDNFLWNRSSRHAVMARDGSRFVIPLLALLAVSSAMSGYIGGTTYTSFAPRKRHWGKLSAISVFAGFWPSYLFILIGSLIASVAPFVSAQKTTNILGIGVVYCIVAFPLSLVGVTKARRSRATSYFSFPKSTVSAVPRPTPKSRILQKKWLLTLSTGLIPSASLVLLWKLVMDSYWGTLTISKVSFLVLAALLGLVCSAACSTALVFVLLDAEDWKWKWTSFLSGASTSIWLFVFSLPFVARLPLSFYGLLVYLCNGLAVLAAVSYFACLQLVKTLSDGAKQD